MLGGLLGQGFGSKCKSLIKPTKTRIESQRRRAEVKQRFLKEDLAKLLANGLDINAYGRTEEFIAGLRLLCCYDYIENFCDYTLKNLSTMQKQRDCPEVCREAVSSLMFAAARFSDLPELRDLRDAFQERYGNSIEHLVNKMFIDTLAAKPPTMEKRLQLLRDIASEFSIKWDSRGFEQRMAKPSALVQDQFKKYGPSHVTTDKCEFPSGKDSNVKASKHEGIAKEKGGNFILDRQNMYNGKEGSVFRREEVDTNFIERLDKPGKGNNLRMTAGGKGEINDVSYRARQELNEEKHRSSQHKEDNAQIVSSSSSSSRGKSIDDIYPLKNSIKNPIAKDERWDALFHGKPEDAAHCARLSDSSNSKSGSSLGEHPNRLKVRNSSKQVQEEEADGLKSYYNSPRPPPYVKLKDNRIPPPYVKHKESNCEIHTRSKHTSFDGDCSSIDPSAHNKAVASLNSYGSQKEQKIPQYDEGSGPIRVNSHGHEKDSIYQNDIPLPKPRSVRKKHSRSSSNQYDDGNLEDAETVRRSSSSRRKGHSRKGLQILFDDEHHEKDEEERMMDKLLLHYSKKASNFDVKKLRKKSHAHASHQIDADGSQLPPGSRAGLNVNAEMVPPSRSKSLPREQPASSEPIKVYARANSFQPDNQAPHVHPKLPDYDDLAARFAALRGQ